VGRVIARPFTGEPGSYERTPNRHDYSLEPRRPNYLSLVRAAGMTVHGVGKIGDIFAGCDIDESHPTKSNVEGIQKTEQLLQELDEGLIFTNLVETDSLWGHRNDPVNFHRCLQDFDRRLPDLLEAAASGRPADSHVQITAATLRRRPPTIRASTRCCSRTSQAATRRARSTRGSSRTSARRSMPGSRERRPRGESRGKRS